MSNAIQFVLDTLSDTWTWLTSWNYGIVSFGFFIVGTIILSMLIRRIFG